MRPPRAQEEGAGSPIAVLRRRKGLTQKGLAELVGVSDKAVSKWERGLSMPDVGLLPKLALVLDGDAAELARGGPAVRRSQWQGLALFDSSREWAGRSVYGKPVVELVLAYFALAGIRSAVLVCEGGEPISPERRSALAEEGMEVRVLSRPEAALLAGLGEERDTMVVGRPVFLYGANLALKFWRAMARRDGLTVLSAFDNVAPGEAVAYDSEQRVVDPRSDEAIDRMTDARYLPIAFCTRGTLLSYLPGLGEAPVPPARRYVEPLRRGVVHIDLGTEDGLLDASNFVRLVGSHCDGSIYDLDGLVARCMPRC